MSGKNELRSAIDQCMIRDRFPLRQQLRRLQHNDETALEKLRSRIVRSVSRAENRKAVIPEVEYDDALPVVQRRDEIAKAIRENQVVVIAGETGSGKTTQLPKICLEAGRGVFGLIGHTQPRRLQLALLPVVLLKN